MNKIIVIGVEPSYLINFRGELLKSMTTHGSNVTTISNIPTNIQMASLEAFDVASDFVTFSRGKLSVTSDLKVFIELIKKYKAIKPCIVLAYTIKPVIWGGIAARFFPNIQFYGLVTGLGFAFQGDSFKRKLLTKLVVSLYKISLKNSKAIIFQNKDNRDIFIEKGIVPISKTHIVNGSGVNIKKYSVVGFPKGNIRFLCIARLLGEKGLREYAQAAQIVRDKFPNVEFDLVGQADPSPDSIPLREVNSWSDYINYKGPTSDVRPYIKNSHVHVLPSYHEGLPRSTLEAMSMGRPILTTNAVGCKDTVENGVNGFKVQVGSVDELVVKMIWFIENGGQIKNMGLESRRMVEDKFDVHKVNKEMLKIMDIR
jgi:glycosyltransferase involved in cell wall biosynthesis